MEVSGKQCTDTDDLCETCQLEGATTQADGFCLQCEEYTCNKCFKNHLKSKPSRNHAMRPLAPDQSRVKKKEQEKLFCPKHEKERRKFYCRQHDAVACGDCIVIEHHGCKMEFIKELSENFKENSEFTEELEKIKNLKKTNEETDELRLSYQTKNACMDEECIKEITKFRKDINDYLDNAESQIVNESKQMSKNNEDRLVQIGQKIETNKADINVLENMLDATLFADEILFINFTESKAYIKEVEKSVKDVQSSNIIHPFKFAPEPRLQKLTRHGIKGGSIITDTGTDTDRYKTIERDTQTERCTTEVDVQTKIILTKLPDYLTKKACKNCRSVFPATQVFCNECRQRLEITCLNCGSVCSANQELCDGCGRRVGIKCQNCNMVWPITSMFCGSCQRSLGKACKNCRSVCPATQDICGTCGQRWKKKCENCKMVCDATDEFCGLCRHRLGLKCQNCCTVWPTTSMFCGSCQHSLKKACDHCRRICPETDEFCYSCGQQLGLACRYCRRVWPKTSTSCGSCHCRLENRTCTNCGSEYPATDEYCYQCDDYLTDMLYGNCRSEYPATPGVFETHGNA